MWLSLITTWTLFILKLPFYELIAKYLSTLSILWKIVIAIFFSAKTKWTSWVNCDLNIFPNNCQLTANNSAWNYLRKLEGVFAYVSSLANYSCTFILYTGSSIRSFEAFWSFSFKRSKHRVDILYLMLS